jgi:hypothetical protein
MALVARPRSHPITAVVKTIHTREAWLVPTTQLSSVDCVLAAMSAMSTARSTTTSPARR